MFKRMTKNLIRLLDDVINVCTVCERFLLTSGPRRIGGAHNPKLFPRDHEEYAQRSFEDHAGF